MESEKIKGASKAANNEILLSKGDQVIFFNAILQPGQPNDALKAAAKSYEREMQNHQPI